MNEHNINQLSNEKSKYTILKQLELKMNKMVFSKNQKKMNIHYIIHLLIRWWKIFLDNL